MTGSAPLGRPPIVAPNGAANGSGDDPASALHRRQRIGAGIAGLALLAAVAAFAPAANHAGARGSHATVTRDN